MTLEDILRIDICPFDEEVLDECIGEGNAVTYEICNSLYNLIIRYIGLFWEKYQSDYISASVPDRIIGACDVETDEYPFWMEAAQDLMYTAVSLNGWRCIWLNFGSGDIELADTSGNDEEARAVQFHEAYMQYLDKCGVDGFERKFFENEEKLMMDAVYYTEYAELGLLFNKKLSAYNALKKQNAAMIQEVCKEEDIHISRLEHTIWMPFWVCFAEEKKECEGEEYGVFLLGNDGYNYYNFDRFDPNWVCKTFVMDQLLDLALKKLEVYIAANNLVA